MRGSVVSGHAARADGCVCTWQGPGGTKRARRTAYAEHLLTARNGRLRVCRDCEEAKDLKRMSTAREGVCKACSTARARRWREEHPDAWERHARRAYLKKRYGITPEQYDELLAHQGGGCAICGGEDADARMYRLHVDHDHATGRVRALLCGGCNRGLGAFADDADRVEAAARYLRAHALIAAAS